MRYHKNPWIDPRVEHLRMFQVETYLRDHGWRRSQNEVTPLRAFRDSQLNGVFLPGKDDDHFLRFAIDAVECLARAEDRYAGDVLTDLLAQAPDNAELKPAIPALPEKPDALPQPVNR